jgi:acyl-coenzyme A thioesterase 9
LCNRTFISTRIVKTDGVFKELTAMRVVTPWIDALDAKRAAESGNGPQESEVKEHQAKEPEPKRMSDSYARVVLPLKKDRWLGDGYLNATGNVRLVWFCCFVQADV